MIITEIRLQFYLCGIANECEIFSSPPSPDNDTDNAYCDFDIFSKMYCNGFRTEKDECRHTVVVGPRTGVRLSPKKVLTDKRNG
jgi:hypothetical protein